jgi:hypothetical protein
VKKAPFSSKAPFLFRFEVALPHGEVHLVEPNRVVRHLAIAILLIVDSDTVPFCGPRRTVYVERMSHTIQADGLEQQIAA